MSTPTKISYGSAPRTFNLTCMKGLDPYTAQYLGDQFGEVFEFMALMGNPHIASEDDGLPPSHPPRNRVRFKLTASLSGGSAAAVPIDGDGSTELTPSITVYDTLGTYSSAGSGDFGIASMYEYPDGTHRWEIDRLGGEGTVTGTTDDERVNVSSNDTDSPAKYLIDCMNDTDTYVAANHQLVYAEEVNDGASETMRLFTSKLSTAETNQIKITSNDSTANYLYDSVTATWTDSNTFDADRQKVYVHEDNDGNDETFSLWTKRSEDTGQVKVSSSDTLAYLESQFADTGTYTQYEHSLVLVESDGAELTLFSEHQTLLARLDADIPARSGTGLGASAADISLYEVDNSGTLVERLTNQQVFNPGGMIIGVETGTVHYAPVTKIGEKWVLNPTDLKQINGYEEATEMHLAKCSGAAAGWEDGSAVTAVRVQNDPAELQTYNFCDGWETVHTADDCESV